jgi:hypothetical protein
MAIFWQWIARTAAPAFLSVPVVFFDGSCETPFPLGGEAPNLGRVLCAFGLARALAQGQGFLVSHRFNMPLAWAPFSLVLF